MQKCDLTVGSVLILHVQLAKTEIAQRNMAGVIKQDILGFEIAVDDLESVKALQGTKKFGSVKAGPVDIKSLLSLKVVEELSAIDKSENKI